MTDSRYTPTAQNQFVTQSGPTANSALGTAALIIGASALVIELLSTVGNALLITAQSTSAIGFMSAVSIGLQLFLGLSALIIGIIALTKKDQPRLTAAAGVALGASALVGVLASALFTFVIAITS